MTIRDGYLHPESVLQAAELVGCKCESWCLCKWGDNGVLTAMSLISIASRVAYRVHLTEVAKAINADKRGKFRKPQWEAGGDVATLTEWILCDGDIPAVQRLRDAIEKAQDE